VGKKFLVAALALCLLPAVYADSVYWGHVSDSFYAVRNVSDEIFPPGGMVSVTLHLYPGNSLTAGLHEGPFPDGFIVHNISCGGINRKDNSVEWVFWDSYNPFQESCSYSIKIPVNFTGSFCFTGYSMLNSSSAYVTEGPECVTVKASIETVMERIHSWSVGDAGLEDVMDAVKSWSS
jgi:hypothetical protein